MVLNQRHTQDDLEQDDIYIKKQLKIKIYFILIHSLNLFFFKDHLVL